MNDENTHERDGGSGDAQAAAVAWADAYAGMWDCADGFHGSLNLSEAVALAGVLDSVDRGDLAATLIREWGIGDPEAVEEIEEEEPGAVARLIDGYGTPLGQVSWLLPWYPANQIDNPYAQEAVTA